MAVFTGLAGLAAGLWAGLSTALVRVAVGVGLSLLGSKLSKKKESKTQSYENGVNLTLQSGGDVARSFVMGRYSTSGSLIYANSWGGDKTSPNAFLTMVIALSDMDVQNITGMWVDGTPVVIANETFEGYGHPVDDKAETYKDHLWLHFHDGRQTTVNSMLTDVVGKYNGRTYDASRIGRGMSYVVITAKANSKIFSGRPNFLFEINGMRLYDPSKDSSVGGNGTHRLADPSTWGGDGDHLPAVQMYNLLNGIYRKNSLGQKVWFYGMQNMASARLPVDNWIAAINFCRENIQGPNGREERFVSGLEIPVNAELAETLDAIRAACNADLIDTGGQYRIVFAEPDKPVLTISDGDILDEGQEYTPFHTLDRSINGITASYPEPNEAWNTKVATPVYSADYEAQDGDRRLVTDVKFTSVYRWSQVQRLMQSSLKAARRERKHSITVPYKFWRVQVGDIIRWDSTRNYYSNKQFRIDEVNDNSSLNIKWLISEVDPTDFNVPQAYNPPAFSDSGVVLPQPQGMVDWYAEPSEIRDNANNARRPAIRLHWYTDLTDIQGVIYEVALVVNGDPIKTGTIDDYTLGWVDIASYAILPNTTYYVRGKYKVPENRTASWSEWISVKTGDIRLTDLDVYLGIDLNDINKKLDENVKWLGEGQKYNNQQIERFDQLIAEVAADSFLQQQSLKREINATVGRVRAAYREEISVVANETKAVAIKTEELTAHVDNVDANFTEKTAVLASNVEAWANRTTAIESTINDPATGLAANAKAISTVTTQVTNIDDKLTAVSNRVDITQAQVGNVTASGLFRVTTESDGTNGTSKIGLSAAVTTGSTTKQAAFFITADSSDRSSIEMIADRVIMTSEGYREVPFVFANGKLRLNAADIGTVQAGEININNRFIVSRDGEVTIRSATSGPRTVMNNGLFEVYDGNNTLRVQLGIFKS